LKLAPQHLRCEHRATALRHHFHETLHLHDGGPAIEAKDDTVEERGARFLGLAGHGRKMPAKNAEHDRRPTVADPRERTVKIENHVGDAGTRNERRADLGVAGKLGQRAGGGAHSAGFSMKA
jgi:hypothetical protein